MTTGKYFGSRCKGLVPAWLLVLLAIVLVLGLGVVILFKPLLKQVNEVRGKRLLEDAQQAFELNDLETAARKGNAAHYLLPDNADIPLMMARILLQQRNASALEWWQRALYHPELPIDELRAIIELTFNSGMVERVPVFLNRLIELDPEGVETRRLHLRMLDFQRRFSQTGVLVQDLVQAEVEDWRVHQRYVGLNRQVAGEEGVQRALQHLLMLIESGGELAISAARELVSVDVFAMEDRLRAAEYLIASSTDPIDIQFARTVQFREGIISEDQLRERVAELVAEMSGEDLEGLAIWATWADQAGWFLQTVPWERYAESGGRVEPYFRTLLESGRHAELLQLVESNYQATHPQGPIMLYYRAQAEGRRGNAVQAESSLALAARTLNAASFERLETLLARDGRFDLLKEIYATRVKQEPNDMSLRLKLLTSLYQEGDHAGLAENIGTVDIDFFGQFPENQTFLIYLNLMHDRALPQMHTLLEKLLVEFPEVYDHQLVLGLSFLLQADFATAASFARTMPPLDLNAPRYLRVAAVALGRYTSQELITFSEFDRLMPKELFLISRSQSIR